MSAGGSNEGEGGVSAEKGDGEQGPNVTDAEGDAGRERPAKRSRAVSTSTPENGIENKGRRIQQQTNSNSSILHLNKLRKMACGSCILCVLPRCGRCFACVSVEGKPGEERTCCIRKMCCKIPTELKLQKIEGLGFPRGWSFSFDDPHKTSLVWNASNILPLAGLRIESPERRLFHSLESAFSHIPHSNVDDAVDMVAKFLAHVGSSHYISNPSHFLVGKSCCIEFTNSRGFTVSLFGKIAACMSLTSKEENSFFIAQYGRDVLSIASSLGCANIKPMQLISSEAAWGGCISFERKTHSPRDSLSVIHKIDQATAVETWVAPDMRMEEMVAQSDGISLPMLTVLARGYKFVFRAGISDHAVTKQYGVFASCEPMQQSAGKELNLRPGELIDLGVFSPLKDEDKKDLSAFIVKNFIHSFRLGRWALISGQDDVVYDLTDNKSGHLHDAASKRLLSYFRKCKRDEYPKVHARLDPNGEVHFLFGIRYQGNWEDYECGMQQLVPMFCRREVEVAVSRRHGLSKKDVASSKYLQSIGMFQMQDIIACDRQLAGMFNSEMTDPYPSALTRRSYQVIQCLEERTQNLLKVNSDAESNKDSTGANNSYHATLNSALQHFSELKERWKAKRKIP